jgi:hypothetical protein
VDIVPTAVDIAADTNPDPAMDNHLAGPGIRPVAEDSRSHRVADNLPAAEGTVVGMSLVAGSRLAVDIADR